MGNSSRFYTYAYLRKDRTPYYIGKGTGTRLYSKNHNISPPKDKSRIILLKQNLTEEEAFKHEIYMIAVFGRKDLGTGILYNMTNGGEGTSGMKPWNAGKTNVYSEETKQKISKSLSGENHPNYGKKHSLKTIEKIREGNIGKERTKETKDKISKMQFGENNHMFGKNHSVETKDKIRKSKLGKKHSEETKEKMKNSWKKRKASK